MSSINKYEPQIQWLGVIPYREALDLQEQRANEVRADHSKATIFGLEHNTVITLGIRGREQEDIFSRMEDLTSEGIEVERVRRGGQATLHSPGQLVIYPILPLRHWGLSTRALMKAMEIATCRLLKEKGILSYRGEKEPGVYTSKGKIAFFGLKINRGVSSHGLAINVSNDLQKFRHIRSCGVSEQALDSLSLQAVNESPEIIFHDWFKCFQDSLNESGRRDGEVFPQTHFNLNQEC